jgi:DNA invertase Pin-like site-specific DNA recombinase
MKVAVYARVSTAHQTADNQTQELERVAALRGWNIVSTYRDDGISGAKGRDGRPALDSMLKAAAKREFDLIAVWSIRSLGSLPSAPCHDRERPSRPGRSALLPPTGDRHHHAIREANVRSCSRPLLNLSAT